VILIHSERLKRHAHSSATSCVETKFGNPAHKSLDELKTDSYRDEAFRHSAIERIRHWQSSTDSIILGVLGPENWRRMIRTICGWRLPGTLSYGSGTTHGHFLDIGATNDEFSVRGDASWTLLEILETCLEEQLRLTILFSGIQRRTETDFPSVSLRDYKNQEGLRGCFAHREAVHLLFPRRDFCEATNLNNLLAAQERDRIVRRLAYRAGIMKMDSALYDVVWQSLVWVIFQLLQPGFIELVERQRPPTPFTRGIVWLEPGQSMRDFAPAPELDANGVWQHILVPRHVIQAAERLGIPYNVYGDGWLTHGDEAAERASARAMYTSPGAAVDNELNSWGRPNEEEEEEGEDEEDAGDDYYVWEDVEDDDDMALEDYDWEDVTNDALSERMPRLML
jgi:hypothetical protein